jgi:hypothetical protein
VPSEAAEPDDPSPAVAPTGEEKVVQVTAADVEADGAPVERR